MADLQLIFDAITPESTKNIPLIKESMRIFLKNLEENSAVAWDIQNIYDPSLNRDNSLITTKGKLNLRTALLKTYLKNMYDIIKAAQLDKPLQRKLDELGVNGEIILNNSVESILGIDYFETNKAFKERVGTIQGIYGAHSLAATLESNYSNQTPKITEIKPFHFSVEGPITSEMYNNIVKPLSHPLGFTYSYRQVIEQVFLDYFGVTKNYTVNAIEIRGSKGSFDVFTETLGQVAIDTVWRDFQTRINFLTGNLFTLEEFNSLVTIHAGKIVQSITEQTTSTGRTVEIVFTDGTAILQFPTSGQALDIIYANHITWEHSKQGIIKDFSPSTVNGHYSLFTDFIIDITFDYYDTIEQFLIAFSITNINDNTGLSGGMTYTDYNGNQVPINTSDFIIMDSTTYVNDTFSILNPLINGVYLYTTDGLYITGNAGANYLVASNI